MNCPTCGNETESGAQFCGICGTDLTSGEVAAGSEQPMVSFGESISRVFSNYFNFSGRATRAENWWWVPEGSMTSTNLVGGSYCGLRFLSDG